MSSHSKEELFELIERLKKDNYQTVTSEDRTLYQNLLNEYKQNKENIGELFTCLTKGSEEQERSFASQNSIIRERNIEIAKTFDIAKHYQSMIDKLTPLKCNDQQTKTYFPDSIETKDVKKGLEASRLTAPTELADCPDKESYLKEANDILSKLTQSKKEPNATLCTIAKERGIELKIIDSKEFDGKFYKEEFDKNGKIIIGIYSGCFSEQNKDKLPMLIAHECGHMIDICNRYEEHPESKNYHVSVKAQEEFLADTLGAEMCTNVGYTQSVIKYKDFLAQSKNPLMQDRVSCINLNPKLQRIAKSFCLSGRPEAKPLYPPKRTKNPAPPKSLSVSMPNTICMPKTH